MKIVVSFCLITVLFFSPASHKSVYAAGYADASSICLLVKENNKKRLRKLLKELHLKIKVLYSSVKCNGVNLVQFAMQHNAGKVGKFLVKKIPASALKKNGDLDWANANGHGDSEVTKALIARVGG